jgi:hypothetical protein
VAQLEFDDTVAQQLESLYNARDVRRRRALVTEALAAASGDRIIDVGCFSHRIDVTITDFTFPSVLRPG